LNAVQQCSFAGTQMAHLLCMVKFPIFFGVRLTKAEYAALLEYKRGNGQSSKSAAACDAIMRQVRYFRWKRSHRGKEARTEEELRSDRQRDLAPSWAGYEPGKDRISRGDRRTAD
jgi:hypothetical protein